MRSAPYLQRYSWLLHLFLLSVVTCIKSVTNTVDLEMDRKLNKFSSEGIQLLHDPSSLPSSRPSSQPSSHPSSQPSSMPSQPTGQPTTQPSCPSSQPTSQPISQPSYQPTAQPSRQPSSRPSAQPSGQPSEQPSSQPTCQPSFKNVYVTSSIEKLRGYSVAGIVVAVTVATIIIAGVTYAYTARKAYFQLGDNRGPLHDQYAAEDSIML